MGKFISDWAESENQVTRILEHYQPLKWQVVIDRENLYQVFMEINPKNTPQKQSKKASEK